MKTLQELQTEFNDLALKRDQITIEMYRLEGEAKILKEIEEDKLKAESKEDKELK